MDVPTGEYLRRRTAADPGLAAGIAAVAAGDVGTAAQQLAAVVESRDDPAARVRAAAYHRLATSLRWNAFPGGSGAGATEIGVRWDGQPSPVDLREDWVALARGTGDEALLAEARTVGGALCALRSLRAIVDHAAVRLTPEQVDGQLAEALKAVEPLRADPDEPGYADLAAADLAHRAGRPERAAEHLRAAAAAYGTAGEQAGLGACHLLRGDWRAAPAGTPETRNLTIVASATESSAMDWTLESAEASLTGLDVDGAAAAYADAGGAFEAAGCARGLAAVALRRGYLATLSGDHDEAGSLAGQAAEQCNQAGDRWGTWLARTHETLAGIGAGRLTGGADTAEQVGAWGSGPGSFSYALGLGLLCSRTGRDWILRRADPERALACHRLARTVFVALGAVTDEAQSLVDGGRVLQVVGDLDGARTAYEEALDLLAADLDARPAAAADNRLRAVALAQSLYQLDLVRRDPASMARGAERLRLQAAALHGAGEDTVEGMLAGAAADTLAQVSVLVPLYRGEEAREAGDEREAEEGYAAALEAARGGEGPDADFLQAVVLAHWRRYPEASAAFQRYLDAQAAKPSLLGRVLARVGPLKAEIALREQRLHEQAGAFFRRLRDYPAAVSHFEALEASGGPRWWERLERPWELLTDYGAAREGLGELPRALELHDQAIAELESRRARLRRDELKTALSGTSGAAAVYLAAARTALRLGEAASSSGDAAGFEAWAERGFDYAERGRARGLLDLLAPSAGLARDAPGSGGAAVRAWHQANAELAMHRGLLATEQAAALPEPDRIAALHEAIDAAERELLEREAALEAADPAFAATVAVAPAVLSLDGVRAELPAGAALLAYHHVDDELLAWAVTADGLVTHRAAVDDAVLSREFRSFAKACARGGNWDLRGAPVARTLLEPFAAVLESVDRLVVVPPPAAAALPFHALPWTRGPLMASHAVSYLPSASSLAFITGTGAALPDRALAVGDPIDPAWQALPGDPPGPAEPLPAAATEAAVVAALFEDTRLLVGAAATEPAVRAEIGGYPVVHLATHGQVSGAAPLLSSVLLAGGEALSVYELLGIHLDADLVVLSACDTGRGTPTAGGEVLGLTRGLLGAGARGAVVAYWATRDRATCVLMARFYRLLRGGAPAPVALQQAQAHLRAMTTDDEEAEFAALEAAVADPAAAADVLSPLTARPDPSPPGRERHPEVWAAFCYVGR